MSDLGYLLWLVATATATILVLTVGTLAAAGLLTRDQDDPEPHPAMGGPDGPRAQEHATAAPEARRAA